MKIVRITTSKSVADVCKEIEEMIPNVLGTDPNKTKQDGIVVYYPARQFMHTDDNMDDVSYHSKKSE